MDYCKEKLSKLLQQEGNTNQYTTLSYYNMRFIE